MTDARVIAMDGPGGTGKGTICSFLATALGWHLLDSGALYRVLAHEALRQGVALDDGAKLATLARGLDVDFGRDPAADGTRVYSHGQDISREIRTEACADAASKVAALAAVRAALLERQRAFRRAPGLVADGRDMGTVVFPGAELKVFLTATPGERAARRYKQLNEKGISVNLHRLSADIAERDARDQARTVSPMKPASDAIVVDTTGIDVADVKRRVVELVRKVFPDIPYISV
jgi:CMP/dCMP kinase